MSRIGGGMEVRKRERAWLCIYRVNSSSACRECLRYVTTTEQGLPPVPQLPSKCDQAQSQKAEAAVYCTAPSQPSLRIVLAVSWGTGVKPLNAER